MSYRLVLLALLALSSAWYANADPNQISLTSPRSLQMRLQGDDTLIRALASSHATPLSLAVDDFDMDGMRDLAAGYAAPDGGRIVIFRGNLDAFAPQSEGSFWAISRSEFPLPFLPDVQVVALPTQPDLLATGMFIGHDGPSLVAATRGGNTIYVLARDDSGNFQVRQTITTPGAITALGASLLGMGSYAQVVVGVRNEGGSTLLVYTGSNDGLMPPEGVALTGDATAFAFGDLDGDGLTDVLVVAGGAVSILHSATNSLEPIPITFVATAAALGTFVIDRNSRLQMALLGDDGSVHILVHESFDPRPLSLAEMHARKRQHIELMRAAMRPGWIAPAADPPIQEGWKEIESFTAVALTPAPLLFRTRISNHAADDVLLLDGGRLLVIAHPDSQAGDSDGSFPPGMILTQPEPYVGPVAALMERVNVDGRPGVIVLAQGDVAPAVMMPLPDPTYTVNTTLDIVNAAATFCANATPSKCSLRQAIVESNTVGGTNTIMVPAGTYTLTLARIAGNFNGHQGTLEVTASVNIVGAAQATTIIQGGTMTNLSDSVDKVFSFNEDIAAITTATVSLSNLTIQNGFNRGNVSIQDGWGGAFDFDTGAGTATLSVTSVTLNNNKLNDGEGGGAAIFNTNNGSGSAFAGCTGTTNAMFSGSTIQNNVALRNPNDGLHDPNGAGNGGGLFIAHPATACLMTTTVQMNTATQHQGTGFGIGGGVWKLGGGNLNKLLQIHGGLITNNQAAGSGGGVLATSALTIDQSAVISNNTAGASGGGVFYNSGNAGTSASLTKVTITGNNASGTAGAGTGVGGGMYVGTAGMPATVSFSRFANNSSQVAGANNLFNQNGSGGTAVTATNNWWGTNAPSGTIFPSTSTCPTPGVQQVCFDPFIVLTHQASPQKIKISTGTSALTADMSKDNHGTAISLSNLTQIIGLPIVFDTAVLGNLSGAGTSLNASAQATATFTAGGTSGLGSAHATVDQAVVSTNSNLISSATESGTTATITTVGAHGFAAGEFVSISGVTVPGYNGNFVKVLSSPAPTTTQFSYTAGSSGLGASSGGTANAGIIILQPPSMTKSFNPTTVAKNTATTLTFTITNGNLIPIDASFTDNLPANLVVANTPSVVNNCGGTVTAVAAATSITYSNPFTTPASQTGNPTGNCTISVNVQSAIDNVYMNSVTLNSSDAGNAAAAATASVTVINPPHMVKAFGATTIPLNGTTSLTFTIDSNTNANLTLTGVAFTDSLPSGLVVATPGNPSTTCTSGSVTAADAATSVSLSGASVAPNTSCTVTVTVKGTTAGTKANTSGAVSSSNGLTGNTASATLTVVAPPTIAKSFSASSIPLNGIATLTFTISNPNNPATPALGDLTGIAFTDTLPSSTGTLVVAPTPNVVNNCNGTVTATAGMGTISLSGGTLVHNSSCTLSVDVKGTVAGDAANTTGNISSTNGGTGTTSNTATLKVVAPPTISKSFGASTIPQNGTTTVTFTITNPAANTTAENGIAFSDTLTNGLQVGSTPGVSNTCNGTVTAAANTTTISLTGGSIATPGNTCTLTVNVTGTQAGSVSNTTGTVSSTNGGTGATSNTAMLTVLAPPSMTKAFGAATIPLNGTTSLTFTLTNPNSSTTLTGVAFTDSLPSGLQVSATPNGSNTCGGTFTPMGGDTTVTLSGGSLAGNATCMVSVDVKGATAGVKMNSVPPTSTNGGTGSAATANITVVAPPTISKAFSAATIPLNGTTTVTFTITNPNTTAAGDLTGITFTDTLPSTTGTLVVAPTPNVVNNCSGTPTAVAGTGTISLSGGTLAHNMSCTLSVDVKGTAAGDAANITGNISSTNGGTGTNSGTVTLKVVAPPTIAKSFGAASVSPNGTTTLTFTITNPSANTTAENGIAFSDTLTNGLQVASTPGVTNTCNGTVTAVANSTSISLSGGSITTPGATCTINVNVTATQAGTVSNTTGAVSSTNGGTGSTSNTATLNVLNAPSIAKSFGAATIPLNGTTPLTFTITNPNASTTLTGVAFTDTLPSGLPVSATPNASNTCGGTFMPMGGDTTVTLSGGSLAGNATCTVSVDVKGTTAGLKTNSVTASSTNGGTGSAAMASITVVAPPTISKSFNPAVSIPLNGTDTLTFTITNPNTTAAGDLTGITFTDTLPSTTGTLVVAPTPNVVNNCSGTPTAVAGTGTISLSGGTLVHNMSCTLSVSVQGTAAGDAANITGNISSTNGGTGTNSGTVTLKVVAPPTISKSFGASNIAQNGTTTLTFTITNPSANTTAENGIAFSDTLTNGLQVASTPGVSNTCGGTVTAVANSTSISLSGGSITMPGTTCTINVNVTGTQSGTVMNTTGAVSSTNGGTGSTSNTAMLNVGGTAPSMTKAFGAATIPLNGTTSLTFTISNPNASMTLTGVTFTDSLPSGLQVAATPGASNTCGGTFNPMAGDTSVILSGASLASNATCNLSVNVTGTTAGQKNNSATPSSTNGGTGSAATASVTVVAPPTISKSFGAASIPLNGTTTVTFTITNPNTTAAGDLTGISVSDTLPNMTGTLAVASTPGVSNTCNGTVTANAGAGSISLSGGTLVHNMSCTLSVNVTGTAAGDAANTTGNISSANGGTGSTSNTATVKVVAPPTIQKSFGAASIAQNGTTTLTFTITNPSANTTAENGIAFSDTLTNGLQVASTPGVSNTCGGTVTAVANSTSISLSGGSITMPGTTCTINVNVTGTQSGTVMNTTGAVSSTNGGTGSTSNTASLQVGSATPTSESITLTGKSGTLNGVRVWTFTNVNNGPGSVSGLTYSSFTLTQQGGTACTPVVTGASVNGGMNQTFPNVLVGNLAPSASASVAVSIDFTGCAANSRFGLNMPFTGNSGAVTGTLVLNNQFQ